MSTRHQAARASLQQAILSNLCSVQRSKMAEKVWHLGLHGEAAVLRVGVGALAGHGAVEEVAGVELQSWGVGGQVHCAAALGRVHRSRQLRPAHAYKYQ